MDVIDVCARSQWYTTTVNSLFEDGMEKLEGFLTLVKAMLRQACKGCQIVCPRLYSWLTILYNKDKITKIN